MQHSLEKLPDTLLRSGAEPGEKAGGKDARQLLWVGACFLIVGLVAAFLAKTIFGGIGEHGPHTNGGWLSVVLALLSVPMGLLLTVLGGAKWLQGRRH